MSELQKFTRLTIRRRMPGLDPKLAHAEYTARDLLAEDSMPARVAALAVDLLPEHLSRKALCFLASEMLGASLTKAQQTALRDAEELFPSKRTNAQVLLENERRKAGIADFQTNQDFLYDGTTIARAVVCATYGQSEGVDAIARAATFATLTPADYHEAMAGAYKRMKELLASFLAPYDSQGEDEFCPALTFDQDCHVLRCKLPAGHVESCEFSKETPLFAPVSTKSSPGRVIYMLDPIGWYIKPILGFQSQTTATLGLYGSLSRAETNVRIMRRPETGLVNRIVPVFYPDDPSEDDGEPPTEKLYFDDFETARNFAKDILNEKYERANVAFNVAMSARSDFYVSYGLTL